MGLTKLAREVLRSSHYRATPSAVLKYAYAKWVFSRFREPDPLRFLERFGIDLQVAMAGFEVWRPKLEQVVRSVNRAPDGQGGIRLEDGMILYGLVRALGPEVIVETGVAAGVSTSFLGAALIENSQGTLFSIELPPKENVTLADGSRYSWQRHGVGWAIPADIKVRLHDRHEMILADVREALPPLLNKVGYVDLFFHDDLHTPDHMLWEYSLVWPFIRPGGVMISDDANFGWLQFCKGLGNYKGYEALRNVNRLTAVRKQSPITVFGNR